MLENTCRCESTCKCEFPRKLNLTLEVDLERSCRCENTCYRCEHARGVKFLEGELDV